MNFLQRTLARLAGIEKRDADSADPYSSMHRLARLQSGAALPAATSLAVADACIRLIAESTASVPLVLYRRRDRENATDHPLYGVLHDQANDTQTAMELREELVVDVLTTGDGYARKRLDSAGRVVALYPMRANTVRVERIAGGRVRYVHTLPEGGARTLVQDEVLHVRYRSANGLTGRSPIEVMRPTFELAAEQQRFSTTFLRRSGRPVGTFTLPAGGALEDNEFDRLKGGLQHSWDGGGTPLLEQGLTFNPIAISQRDAQFIEQVKLTSLDICRIYRVPPPSVGILDDATYSNITEQSAMLVKHCLRPWMVRIEQTMTAALLTPRGRRKYAIEHNAEGLLRGSQGDRFEAYRIAREWGWMNVNDVRRLENLPGIGDAGDEYRVPMNSEALGADSRDRQPEGDPDGAAS